MRRDTEHRGGVRDDTDPQAAGEKAADTGCHHLVAGLGHRRVGQMLQPRCSAVVTDHDRAHTLGSHQDGNAAVEVGQEQNARDLGTRFEHAPDDAVPVDDRIAVAQAVLAAGVDENAARERPLRISDDAGRHERQARLFDDARERGEFGQPTLRLAGARFPGLELLVLRTQPLELIGQRGVVLELLPDAAQRRQRNGDGLQHGRHDLGDPQPGGAHGGVIDGAHGEQRQRQHAEHEDREAAAAPGSGAQRAAGKSIVLERSQARLHSCTGCGTGNRERGMRASVVGGGNPGRGGSVLTA